MARIARPMARATISARWQLSGDRYRLGLARSEEELRSALRLRYRVFNLELREGLETSHGAGEDRDEFDDVMRHLIVRDTHDGQVVGTYRMQTGIAAAGALGYYSAREFDFGRYQNKRSVILELGRACIDASHRNLTVLSLLWKGVASYALACHCHLLVGCSSLTSQDAEEGQAAYSVLKQYEVSSELRTQPLPGFALAIGPSIHKTVRIPKLLRAYLSIGARIAGPPAIDREFKTIDFLTILDLKQLPAVVRSRFL